MIHRELWKKNAATYGVIFLGTCMLAFGLYNIHERTSITEGGVLGMTLLLQHWFGLSPSITSPIMDISCFLLAWRFLGNSFAKYAIAASLSFAGFHAIWEQFPPLLPDLSSSPLLAAVAGACVVGVGVGLVVRVGGASGGDDALALTISHVTGWPIARCYLLTDLTVLGLSLSYIPFSRIIYSLVTVTISSVLIGWVQKAGRGPKRPEKVSAENKA